MKQKILIVGGCGFVGSNLAVYFARRGHDIVCFDNLVRRGSEFNLKELSHYNNITYVHGDARNEEDFINLKNLTGRQKFSIALECSAQPSAIDGYSNPKFDVTNNLYGLVNVLEFCRKEGSGLIFWSTNKVYGGELCNSPPHKEEKTRLVWSDPSFSLNGWSDPNGFNTDLNINGGDHSIYGVTKAASDLLCQEWADAYDIPLIINRFSCLYGPRQFGKVSQGWVVWFQIAKALKKELQFCGYKGKQVRDCLFSEDLCRLIDKQIKNIDEHRGSYYNVGGGKDNTLSLVELNSMMDGKMMVKSVVRHIKQRRADQKIYISDIREVCEDFDWAPEVSLEEGLERSLVWVRENLEYLKYLYR